MLTLFQSTPVIANGRIGGLMTVPYRAILFQSTPVIANGRISGAVVAGRPPGCFNPRPLLLTGESLQDRVDLVVGDIVSIHARYC